MKYLNNFLDGVRLHEAGGNPFLDGDDDPFGSLDPDGSRAQLDGLDGILNLETFTN
jgi:hypothetical protein